MTMESKPAPKYLEIKLAWSEYKKAKWSSKKISKDIVSSLDKISRNGINKNVDKKQIRLTSVFVEDKLYIKLLAWAEHYPKYFDKQSLDGFCFDNCNSSPSIVLNSTMPLEYYEIINNTDNNAMVLKEKNQDHKVPTGNDTFAIFSRGLCKIQISQTSDVTLFDNTPGTFRLFSNHHNIKRNYFLPAIQWCWSCRLPF